MHGRQTKHAEGQYFVYWRGGWRLSLMPFTGEAASLTEAFRLCEAHHGLPLEWEGWSVTTGPPWQVTCTAPFEESTLHGQTSKEGRAEAFDGRD